MRIWRMVTVWLKTTSSPQRVCQRNKRVNSVRRTLCGCSSQRKKTSNWTIYRCPTLPGDDPRAEFATISPTPSEKAFSDPRHPRLPRVPSSGVEARLIMIPQSLRNRASPYGCAERISSMHQAGICMGGLAILEVGGQLVDLSLAPLVSASGPSGKCRGPRRCLSTGLDAKAMTLHVNKPPKLTASDRLVPCMNQTRSLSPQLHLV
ncbi:hypothetical protein BJY00DRAFT_220768 [Aspergillus carlsbadensis]|nr:hypothetical protein BJY00DRAFT_220768 [Aspergillus carlsbadensis]